MRKDVKQVYKEKAVPALMNTFKYKNIEQVPKLVKISINRGLGENARNTKELQANLKEISSIAGQQPIVNKAKKSIAGFKIRDGMNVGASVTLRKAKMYSFIERLVHIILPRIRDFRGISAESFDGRGNYTFGVKDQLIFPEISYDNVENLSGFDISIVTTAKTDEEAYYLLKSLGLPLKPLS